MGRETVLLSTTYLLGDPDLPVKPLSRQETPAKVPQPVTGPDPLP